MLAWIAIKTFLKKVWEMIKKYWKYFLALIYGIGVWLIFRGQAEKVKKVLEVAKNSHEKQIDKIEEIHEQEIKKRDKIIAEYNKIVEGIEKKYAEDNKKLSKKKKEEIKKLVEDYKDNPTELAKLLGKSYGFLYIISGETD